MKLGGTRLITPLWTTSTSTCWSLLPPRRLSLPDPPVCQRICWSALIFVGNIGLKGRFVQPKHHQPHTPTFKERKCQHCTWSFKNEVFRIVCVLTRDVKNADCFVCRIYNNFLRACKISNKYFYSSIFAPNHFGQEALCVFLAKNQVLCEMIKKGPNGPKMAPNDQKHVLLIIWDHFGPP